MPADDLAVLNPATGRQRSGPVYHDPRVDRLRVHERRFRGGDPADVHVVLATLEQSQRRQLLRVHVLEILVELLLRDRDRAIGGRLVDDERRLASSSASAATTLSGALPAGGATAHP